MEPNLQIRDIYISAPLLEISLPSLSNPKGPGLSGGPKNHGA